MYQEKFSPPFWSLYLDDFKVVPGLKYVPLNSLVQEVKLVVLVLHPLEQQAGTI